MKYQVTVAGRTFEIEVENEHLVRVNGHPLYVDLEQVGGLPLYSLGLDNAGYLVFVEEGEEEYRVEVQGQDHAVQVQKQRPSLHTRRVECANDGGQCMLISAPLAGHLVSRPVATGDRVEAGQVVAVVESMKMQMELKAPQAGIVEVVHESPGQDVSQGQELVTLRVQ